MSELEAGRALDAEVAEKVMGWTWKRDRSFRIADNVEFGEPWRFLVAPDSMFSGMAPAHGDEAVKQERYIEPPHYSTDIAAAALVIKRVAEIAEPARKTLRLVVYPYSRTYAAFSTDEDSDAYSEGNGEHATELAICRAALAALSSGLTVRGEQKDSATETDLG